MMHNHEILEMVLTGCAKDYKVNWKDIVKYKHGVDESNTTLHHAQLTALLVLYNFFSYSDVADYLQMNYDTVKTGIQMAHQLVKSESFPIEPIKSIRNKIDNILSAA